MTQPMTYDLVRDLRMNGKDPIRTLESLKQYVKEMAELDGTRKDMAKLLMTAGVPRRTAYRFLEAIYKEPHPVVRLQKEIKRMISREEKRQIDALVEKSGNKAMSMLRKGRPWEEIVQTMVDGLAPLNLPRDYIENYLKNLKGIVDKEKGILQTPSEGY
jgi:hypothetical protein